MVEHDDMSDPADIISGFLEPLPMQNAGERLADRLVTAIALGEFVPGQKLPSERELSTMLNVGRGVVREALQRLAASGYVSVKRGRNGGTFIEHHTASDTKAIVRRVLGPERQRINELLDLRSLVESMVAHTAALRRDESDIQHIRRAVEAYADAGDDRHSSGVADRNLHLAIHRATHNPLLEALTYRIRAEVSLGFGIEPYSPLLRERALHQHPELAEAVIAGDADLAAHLAAEHFFLSEDMLKRLMSTLDEENEPRRTKSPTKNPKNQPRSA
jgi:GntR family transcriptional regulator, transcriptional repressor for pyruvate dehydrogenase complex